MKKILTIVSLSLLGVTGASFAAEVPASSQITKVTVYQDRALVTREAEVELAEGPNTILFEGLPSTLLEDSLRADGKGSAPVAIDGVELKKMFTPEEVNPRAAKVTEELEKLQSELKEIQSRSSALGEQRAFLDSIKNFSSVQVPKDLITKNAQSAEWASLSQFILDAYTDLGKKTLELEKAAADKNKAIEAKQREWNELQSGRNIEKKTAMVTVPSR